MEKDVIINNDLDEAPKTGDWGYAHPQIDAEKCIGCSNCVPFCPDACIAMRKRKKNEASKTSENFKNKPISDFDLEFCKGCGVCAQVCPTKAIAMKNK
ncbi:MAG: hypothetical protein ACD_11C00017G0026 [uncultured bacterium]|nr:MAG: hypothetical protein ACD_11C00017G0026 [uncultured bacterium]HBR71513.1 pyruvate ferredoxin oxidoreductase [Candidatus Moranbacteria bacterium]